MILDRLEHIGCYPLPSEVNGLITFLAEHPDPALGDFDIGNGISVHVMSYPTKGGTDCTLEAHRKYVDFQYLIDGSEQIAVAFEGTPSRPYQQERDIALYVAEPNYIQVKRGDFFLLFPQDLHAAGFGSGSEVKKLLAKIPIELFQSAK